MDFLLDALTEWLKEMLVGGIMGNLSGMFDSVNQQVGDISVQVGQTPQGWNGGIFSMIQNLSNSIMVPIAGVILAIVMTLELIQMITDKNNLHDVDTWMIFKWVFKSAAAILLVTNTWNIVMGVFDMAQSVVAQASGIISSDAAIDISSVLTDMEPRLMEMDLGPLFGLWFQSMFIGVTMWALYICIFIVIYGRMIEIYLVTSVAPIPMAAMMGKEWSGMGQNYLRSLLALGFQAFLIIVCVNGFLAQHGGQLLEGSRLLAAQENGGIHIADDGIGVVLVDGFQLALRLQDQTGGDLTASDGGHQLFQFGNLADVGALVDKAAHMDRQPPAVHIVGFFAEQIEQLGVAHRNQKVKGIVRIAHNEEQGSFPISQSVQLQLIVGSDLPKLGNIEHGKARTAGNQD